MINEKWVQSDQVFVHLLNYGSGKGFLGSCYKSFTAVLVAPSD